jgi:hypothetical protein
MSATARRTGPTPGSGPSWPSCSLVGFCVIGLFSDGAASVGLRWDKKRSPIPTALMPQYIAEVIRRDLITAPEAEEQACHVVNRSNGWED